MAYAHELAVFEVMGTTMIHEGSVVHHRDFNQKNNEITNLI